MRLLKQDASFISNESTQQYFEGLKKHITSILIIASVVLHEGFYIVFHHIKLYGRAKSGSEI